MPDKEILNYIQTARSKGASDEAIKKALAQAGWAEADVAAALAPAGAGVPVAAGLPAAPSPRSHSFGMWMAFEYILFFISLLVFAVALAGIAHNGVDQFFKDAASYSFFSSGPAMQYNLAALIVSFPILAIMVLVIQLQILRQPAIKSLRLRKILIYIALIWTFIAMIVRVIRVVFGFLNGTATLNSLMHLAVTLVICGAIFLYFIFQVKEDRKIA